MLNKRFQLMDGILLVLLVLLTACGGSETAAPVDTLDTISLADLEEEVNVHTVSSIKDNDDVFLLDVREPWEYEEAHIPGVTLLPMGEVASRLSEIPTDKEVIVTCRSGNRSGQVADFLRQNGFDNIHNMSGGILAWQEAGFQVER